MKSVRSNGREDDEAPSVVKTKTSVLHAPILTADFERFLSKLTAICCSFLLLLILSSSALAAGEGGSYAGLEFLWLHLKFQSGSGKVVGSSRWLILSIGWCLLPRGSSVN